MSLVRKTVDGVTTETEYRYDDIFQRHFQVKEEIMINSDGKRFSNAHFYPSEFAGDCSLGGFSNGTNFLQTVDYTYNEQGWITQINDPFFSGGGSGNRVVSTVPDIFHMKISYDEELDFSNDGIGNPHTAPAQKNENISHVEWQTLGKDLTTYGFQYDYLDRLTAARYGTVNNSTATHTGIYDTDYVYADARGNLQSIVRNGVYWDGSDWVEDVIDNLTFTYPTRMEGMETITTSNRISNGI